MAKKTTQIGLIAGAGVGAAAAAALRRRWARSPDDGRIGAAAGDRTATAAGEHFLDHLGAAIRIPTVSHEDRTLDDAAEFERMHAFLAETYPLVHRHLEKEVVAGRSALFTWEGSDPSRPSVMLMAHIDVVPVEAGTEDDWAEPPFGGVRSDGYVWGRGALDFKAGLIGILEAVEGLLGEGFVPETTLLFSMGHDEEIGGIDGTASVAALLAERGVRLGIVLDEGGAIALDMLPGVEEPVALVGIGEKGYLNVELSADGTGGHSSMPPATTAVGKVAAAVAALERRPMAARLDVQRSLFEALSRVVPGPMGWALRNAGRLGGIVERRLSASPTTNALIRTTGAVTMVDGGVKPNVLPQHARAVVNFRILPGDTQESVLAHVRSVVGSEVAVRVLESGFTADPVPLADPGSSAFELVAETIREVFGGIAVAPWILMGATDSRYVLPLADTVLRFAPYSASPADMGRIHGTDERIRVSDADRAVDFYTRFIRRACG